MNDLKLIDGKAEVDKSFDFMGHKISVLIDKDGGPWFVATEIAEVLGYADPHKMTNLLDADEIQNRQIGGFGNRGVNLINESGMYMSVLLSKKPKAKEFRKWVTAEVLPSIRQIGTYSKDNSQKITSSQRMVSLPPYAQKEIDSMQSELVEMRAENERILGELFSLKTCMGLSRHLQSNAKKVANLLSNLDAQKLADLLLALDAQKIADSGFGTNSQKLTNSGEFAKINELIDGREVVVFDKLFEKCKAFIPNKRTLISILTELGYEFKSRARVDKDRRSLWVLKSSVFMKGKADSLSEKAKQLWFN